VAALNANQLSFAIWNDATSCVDIGDVTYIEDGPGPAPEFIELKEGRVNDEIVNLLGLEGLKFEDALKVFSERYGNEGVKQFHRVLRQASSLLSSALSAATRSFVWRMYERASSSDSTSRCRLCIGLPAHHRGNPRG